MYCLGNVSKGFSVDNMKKVGLYGTVLIMVLLQLIIY